MCGVRVLFAEKFASFYLSRKRKQQSLRGNWGSESPGARDSGELGECILEFVKNLKICFLIVFFDTSLLARTQLKRMYTIT